MSLWFLKAEGGVFKCLVLSDRDSNTQIFSVDNDTKKQQILTFEKMEPANVWLAFFSDNRLIISALQSSRLCFCEVIWLFVQKVQIKKFPVLVKEDFSDSVHSRNYIVIL